MQVKSGYTFIAIIIWAEEVGLLSTIATGRRGKRNMSYLCNVILPRPKC